MPGEERRGPSAGGMGESPGGRVQGSPDADWGEEEVDWPPAPPVNEPGTAGGLLDDTAALIAERDEYLLALQRLQADFENYRKRVQRQQEELVDRSVSQLVGKLLPILDVLDLAQAHLGESDGPGGEAAKSEDASANGSDEAQALSKARSLLLDALAKEGLERIDQSGVTFDPVVHDAVSHLPAEEPSPAVSSETADPDSSGKGAPSAHTNLTEPTVGEVFRAGYRWRGQTLRPAMVQVRG